ncbi:MAG: hypothetical protein ACPGVH_09840 [Chitinophagales bacterium]
MKILFEETQKFKQKWIWILLVGLFIFSITMPFLAFFQNPNFQISKTFITGNILNFIIFIAIFLLFYFLKLSTKITSEAIEMQYFPFIKKNVTWSDIESTEVLDYGFVGGWGIRFGTKYGTVYNVSGSKGLHIKLKNGKHFLIGSQKTEILEKILNEFHQ